MPDFDRVLVILAFCSLGSSVGLNQGLKDGKSLEKVLIDGNGALYMQPESTEEGHPTTDLQVMSDGSTVPQSTGEPGTLEFKEPPIIRKADVDTPREESASIKAWPGHSNLQSASLLWIRLRSKAMARLGLSGSTGSTPDSDRPASITMKSALVQAVLVFMGLGVILTIAINVLGSRSRTGEADDAPLMDAGVGGSNEDAGPRVEKTIVLRPEGLDEDLYGMALASLIRDSQRFAVKSEVFWLRFGRLSISLLVLGFTMTLQTFLLYEMKHLVTSVSTKEARETYDKYELWMYGNTTGATTLTKNGYHRGVDGYFNASRFASFDDASKDSVCQMPLSQPTFFVGILLVWTLVIMAEMRRTFDIGGSLIWATPTIDSMANSLTETPEEGDEAVIVVGLTLPIKLIAGTCVLLPRLIVSSLLLWLGCRWLTGTMGFGDVLQNAVTLEFILLLKDLFYKTMAPHHNKLETRNTLILPYADRAKPSSSVFLGAFLWGIISICFVLIYMEVGQQVLPEYRWDIHDACADYLASTEAAVAS